MNCTKTGCSEHATGVCQGCHTAAYCGQVHMEEDWASHRHACNLLTQSRVGATMWAVEAEINEAQDKDGEHWVPMQLTHRGHAALNDHVVDNEHLAEEIGARADFQNDLSILRGVQRLPSGSMHNGERVSVFVKTATFETEVNVQLPGRAHYNIFKRDGGYNVYLTRDDIRRNGQFRPVPLKGMIAVGLGTAEQKALVFGDYAITQLAPERTALRALDFLRRVVRRPRLIRLRGIDRSTQMAVSITMEQAVSVGSEGIGDPNAVYNISYVEIYVPYLFQSGNPPDLSWTQVFEKELTEDATRTTAINEELKVEAAIACLSDATPDQIEAAVKSHDGFDALHEDDAAFVANAIGAFIAEEIGAESPFEGGEALEDTEDGLIGALVTDGMAEVHDQTGEMQLDEIGANVISRWLKRRRAKRAAKKRQQSSNDSGDDNVNAQIQAHLDTIDAGIRDYVKRKRNLARQRKGLDGMSVSELEAKLIDTVKQIKQARGAKRVAGDKVRLANSILTKLDSRGKLLSPAAQQASADLVDLTKGTSAVRGVKRKQARATAARVKRAGQDAIDNGPSSSDSQSEDDSSSAVENPAQTAALVGTLLQHQDRIRAEKKQLSSQGKTVPSAVTRMDEDLSRITSVLSQHIEALCKDTGYEVIPDTVVGAFDRGLALHRQLVVAAAGRK